MTDILALHHVWLTYLLSRRSRATVLTLRVDDRIVGTSANDFRRVKTPSKVVTAVR